MVTPQFVIMCPFLELIDSFRGLDSQAHRDGVSSKRMGMSGAIIVELIYVSSMNSFTQCPEFPKVTSCRGVACRIMS